MTLVARRRRDGEIAQRRRAGALIKVLAVEFEMTEGRVSQICKACGAAPREKTQFRCGHEKTPGNLSVQRVSGGRFYFRCLECKNEAERRYMRRRYKARTKTERTSAVRTVRLL